MATVRFSKELIESIKKAATGAMQPAVDRALLARPSNEDWAMVIYDGLFEPLKPHLTALPAAWFKHWHTFLLQTVRGTPVGLQFAFPAGMPFPMDTVVLPCGSRIDGQFSKTVYLDGDRWQPLQEACAAHTLRAKAAMARRDDFVKMVMAVVKAHTTLAPALKAWPPLWDLIPEDVKERHRKITVREKAEVTVNVDLEKLTALSAAAKFGV